MLSQIDGVLAFQVETIPDERGCVLKMAHPTFPVMDVYATTVHCGAIKAWHGYETKQIFYTVVSGKVKLVLVDMRSKQTTYQVFDEVFLGENAEQSSIQIPPGVYAGFKGISQKDAIIVVQASEKYGQIYRVPYNAFDYDWSIHHG